jgi:tetratricopeptide (TPR) repeat protein
MKEKSTQKNEPERNIVDEMAASFNLGDKIEVLETKLEKLSDTELSSEELESWHHLYGICAFQRGDHQEALERFKNGNQLFPENAQIKFSLAQEYIYTHQPGEAFPMFDECMFPRVPREYGLAMSRYAYLFGEYERGIKYLEKFFELYRKIKVLDDHFLYVRGLPFFGTAWSHLSAHYVLAGKVKEIFKILKELSSVCHDYHFEFLGRELEALVNDDYSDLLPSLEKKREEILAFNLPSGYHDMKIAVVKSGLRETYQESISTLDSVVLTEKDHPWLEDVRVLAKAENANRFGESLEEGKFLDRFLTNQPLLLEPDHAVSFGFLRYQELIKPKVGILLALD